MTNLMKNRGLIHHMLVQRPAGASTVELELLIDGLIGALDIVQHQLGTGNCI
jgi:hypothetical protein